MQHLRLQNTIHPTSTFTGIGLHTGEIVSIRFLPAPEGHGVVFERTDLPGRPRIPASIESVCDTARNTTLAKEDVRLYTVEHVLAALRAHEIDNVCIEITGDEPPAAGGSSS